MSFGEKAFQFLAGLKPSFRLPKGVEALVPFESEETIRVNKLFFERFYNEDQKRRLILGINPGRFGAGVTGIAFTDPIRLESKLGIENAFAKKPELSSEFIYRMIDAYGGAAKFYRNFFISAVCPLGFVMNGKNLNYYDLPALEKAATPFIIESIQQHIRLGAETDIAYCLGEGKNFRFLSVLNEHHQFFKQVVPLAHPRFIMQYRRKMVDSYIKAYIDAFGVSQ